MKAQHGFNAPFSSKLEAQLNQGWGGVFRDINVPWHAHTKKGTRTLVHIDVEAGVQLLLQTLRSPLK